MKTLALAALTAGLSVTATALVAATLQSGGGGREEDGAPTPLYPTITPLDRTQPQQRGEPCLPAGLLAGARIVALGAYEGRGSTDLAIGDGPHETGAIAVTGNPKGDPVVLVLTAYEATIWDLRRFPRRRLRAVLAFGHYDQAVAGVPSSIPVRFQRRGQSSPCGQTAYAYKGGRELERLAAAVTQATGRRIDDFQGGYSATAFDVDRGAVGASGRPFDIGQIRASAEIRRERLLPKAAGIAQLVAEGALRAAGPADIDALSEALTRASPTGYLAPVRPEHLGPRAFVVLRPTAIPRGMYGAHSAVFLIPGDIEWPVDPGSHNTYYSLSSGKCRGPFCGH
ncbi:hypothetical protein FHS95_003817 [Sphingomonas naasensis]|uniref:Cell envelope-related transcriptional attenuator domain-containing protein n=1 Tax=Sphingomonas naasensis TaxID=1344951 RepID=A0A4S1WHT2_9SPHN|nr:hypothetical protein [Sphingomonas naasensis]NIJ22106.1 hypothetical protein [Sphingomonas naasensis]TGX42223.1 hypothetical protein E5A74_10205 [Sphingomonas naasensis]